MNGPDIVEKYFRDFCFPEVLDKSAQGAIEQKRMEMGELSAFVNALGTPDGSNDYNRGLLFIRAVLGNRNMGPSEMEWAISAMLRILFLVRDKRGDLMGDLADAFNAAGGPHAADPKHVENYQEIIARLRNMRSTFYPRARMLVNSRNYIKSTLGLRPEDITPLAPETTFYVMGTCFAVNLHQMLNQLGMPSIHVAHQEEVPVETVFSNIETNEQLQTHIAKDKNPCFILTLGFAEFEILDVTTPASAETELISDGRSGLAAFQTPETICQFILDGAETLRKTNPALRLFVTVSPVPLQGTRSGLGIFDANSISKSIVRLAIAQACAKDPTIQYFPSYEIVTQVAPSAGVCAFGEDDGHPRHVNQQIVELICGLFIETFCPWQKA